MQEFDFTKRDESNELSEMTGQLSHEEAAAAIAAIHATRAEKKNTEAEDFPENEEETLWLEKQNFKNTADDAYTG